MKSPASVSYHFFFLYNRGVLMCYRSDAKNDTVNQCHSYVVVGRYLETSREFTLINKSRFHARLWSRDLGITRCVCLRKQDVETKKIKNWRKRMNIAAEFLARAYFHQFYMMIFLGMSIYVDTVSLPRINNVKLHLSLNEKPQ